jgi:3-phenylpropionate/trans-cinnamate dioxygenase ferredoxin reductase subunit
MTPPDDIVVVGASLAGLRAVEALRRRGYAGKLTLIGAEPERPYDRPPLSKQILRGEWEPERSALKTSVDLTTVDLRLGQRAVRLDTGRKRVELASGDSVPYGALVIATGATARRLPGADDKSHVFTLRTLADAIRIRRALLAKPTVAIVGAGFIGLEVAASCRALGLHVTVVETAETPLASLGRDVGRAIAELHVANGVDFRTGVAVKSVDGADGAKVLHLKDGSTVPAEVVIVGIGVTPETEWLAGSGVALDNGVLCDAAGRTNVPNVVACGDVARSLWPLYGEQIRVEHWTSAVEQANAAVAALLDPDAPVPSAVPYFWSDQYDAKIQFAGRVRPDDTLRILEGSVAERNAVAIYGRAGKLTGVLAINKPAALIRNRRAIAEGAAF